MFFWDITYLMLIPAVILALYAQIKVQSTYRKYSHVSAMTYKTGAQVAREILDAEGLEDVEVEAIPGNLTDHYDPRAKVLRLSHAVYRSNSIAALGIAAHETGHAIQHNVGYLPLKFRSSLFPIASFGSNAAWPLFLMGFFFQSGTLMDFGILLFIFAVLFQVITLPVEFNASGRAIKLLETGGYINRNDIVFVKKVLDAAALTYVAATAMAILQLLRLLMLRGNRD